MRRNKNAPSVPSKIYSYNARAPIVGRALVDEQIYQAHRYRNQLVEIELCRRAARDEAIKRLHPNVQELQDAWQAADGAVEEAIGALNKRRADARSRLNVPAANVEIKRLKGARKEVYAALKAAKAEARDSLAAKAEFATIDAVAHAAVKAARKETPVYWGTYLTVETAVQQAKSSPSLRFQRFDGDGKLAVQLQGGMDQDDLLGGRDCRVRVEAVDLQSLDCSSRSARRKAARTKLWLRIGSEGRAPIWAVVPFAFDRPLPEGARIKWCHLVRRRVAGNYDWQVQFVVSAAEGFDARHCGPGTVGIDLGYRRREHGLRVAYWIGDDGREGELLIPERQLARVQKCRDLQEIRSKSFDAMLLRLRGWLRGRALPDWIVERTANCHVWKIPGRIASLAIAWREGRFEGDSDMFVELEAWRKDDKHLWEWQEHQRRRFNRWRQDAYRKFSAELRSSYGIARIEKLNLSQLARRPAAEDEPIDGAARHHRMTAGLSVLVRAIDESGMEVEKLPAKDTTRRCHECGRVNRFDEPAKLLQTCAECGASWDQDRNAAANLLSGELLAASSDVR